MRNTTRLIFPSAIAIVGAFLLLSGCAKKETELQATIETSMGDIVVRLFDKQTPKTVENFVGLADGTRLLKPGTDAALAEPYYDGLTFHRVMPGFMIQGGCVNGNGTGSPGYTFADETYAQGAQLTGAIPDEATAEYVFEQLILPHLRQNQGKSPIPFISDLFTKMRAEQSIEPMLETTVEQITEALGATEPLFQKGELINHVRYGSLCMANSGPNTNGSQFFIVTAEEGIPYLDGVHTVFGEVVSGMDVVLAIADAPKTVDARGELSSPIDPVVTETIRVKEVAIEPTPQTPQEEP